MIKAPFVELFKYGPTICAVVNAAGTIRIKRVPNRIIRQVFVIVIMSSDVVKRQLFERD